jgi:hypothetical protein
MKNLSHHEGRTDFIGPRMPHTQMDLDSVEVSQVPGVTSRQPLVHMQEVARIPIENPRDRLFLTMRGKRIEEELLRISVELDQELEAQRKRDEQAAQQAVENLPLASLPQKVQTLTYEKIRFGLELL